jgi:predicted choloylglycine hydrolase
MKRRTLEKLDINLIHIITILTAWAVQIYLGGTKGLIVGLLIIVTAHLNAITMLNYQYYLKMDSIKKLEKRLK